MATRIISQTIDLTNKFTDKYITVIDDGGIRIHPVNTQQSSVVINAEGMTIFTGGTNENNSIAQYGTTTRVGNQNGFHIEMDGQELGFYQSQTSKVAYIRNDQLFIPQSVVLDEMAVGLPFGQVNPSTGETTFGQWSWKLHLNGENPRRNNLTLKWIG